MPFFPFILILIGSGLVVSISSESLRVQHSDSDSDDSHSDDSHNINPNLSKKPDIDLESESECCTLSDSDDIDTTKPEPIKIKIKGKKGKGKYKKLKLNANVPVELTNPAKVIEPVELTESPSIPIKSIEQVVQPAESLESESTESDESPKPTKLVKPSVLNPTKSITTDSTTSVTRYRYPNFKKIYSNSSRKIFVTKALFKLYWPRKVDHYDKMYNLLMKNDGIYNITPASITICRNNITEAIIYPSGQYCVSKWINYYAPNIGQSGKSDPNHMFPFVLDIILKNWSCVESVSTDINHFGGSNTLAYFYGELRLGDRMEVGCFEYFINSFGTLFHRMFRPYADLLPHFQKYIDSIKPT